jgi:hypothetical protein
MSRRHHGRPHHGRHRPEGTRPDQVARPTPPATTDVPVETAPEVELPQAQLAVPSADHQAVAPSPIPATSGHVNGHAGPPDSGNGVQHGQLGQNGNGVPHGMDERSAGCTAPQLRRFIKSRPYVPMHELRRRFAIDGGEDDVTQVPLDGGHVYVGLPAREGSLLGELLRGGEIGYELSFDPRAPIVVGVYPMRPVPRP